MGDFDDFCNDSIHEFAVVARSEEHTSELQSRGHLVCRLLLEKKKANNLASHDFQFLNVTIYAAAPRHSFLGCVPSTKPVHLYASRRARSAITLGVSSHVDRPA